MLTARDDGHNHQINFDTTSYRLGFIHVEINMEMPMQHLDSPKSNVLNRAKDIDFVLPGLIKRSTPYLDQRM